MTLPIYKQIQNELIEKIENGDFLPNEQIPSERELAETFSVNRLTVSKAINHLEEMGYLYRVHGKGTFIKGGVSKIVLGTRSRGQNGGFTAVAKSAGFIVNSKVIYCGNVTGYSSMCSRLRISLDEPIFALHRIRYNDEAPVLVEYTYVPAAYFSEIENQDFSKVSLYDFMDKHNMMPIDFSQKLVITKCPKREMKLLKIEDENEAVFSFEYLGRNAKGEVVEYTRAYYKTTAMLFKFNQFYSGFVRNTYEKNSD